jgi:hypothetical protein
MIIWYLRGVVDLPRREDDVADRWIVVHDARARPDGAGRRPAPP